MSKIFISYRREDSADVTGRIGDRLRDHFGGENIFTDVDDIPLGVDFRAHLDEAVSQCDVLLAVIGRDWLTVKNSDDKLRLDDPADFVRVEIESALQRDIPVIPLLVRGAKMPRQNQLPESIQGLAYRNAQPVRADPDFSHDVGRLIRSLDKHKLGQLQSSWLRDKMKKLGVGVAVVLSVALYLLFSSSSTRDATSNPQSLADTAAPRTDFIPPDMVRIPEGSFMMGSDTSVNDDERPVREVSVPAFELARNELTWAEWLLCEDDGACSEIERPLFFDKIDVSEQSSHPVVYVNLANVIEYLNWINNKTGRGYRLPSEAEWEYAARAGSKTDYFWGDSIGENQANCAACGSRWDAQSTAPVGSFDENPFGLNDMHGNVREWVADCWHYSYEGAPGNGSAWLEDCTGGNDRQVVRGGSWGSELEILRATSRTWLFNVDIGNHVGFRLARSLPDV